MNTSTWPGPDPDKAWQLGCYMDKLSACGAIIHPRVITDKGLEAFDPKEMPKLTDQEIRKYIWLLLTRSLPDADIVQKTSLLFYMVKLVQKNRLQELPDKPLWICDDFQRGKVRTKEHGDLLLVGYFINHLIRDGMLQGFPSVLEPDSGAYEYAQNKYRKGLRVNPEELPEIMNEIYKVAWEEHEHVPVAVNLAMMVSIVQHCCFEEN